MISGLTLRNNICGRAPWAGRLGSRNPLHGPLHAAFPWPTPACLAVPCFTHPVQPRPAAGAELAVDPAPKGASPKLPPPTPAPPNPAPSLLVLLPGLSPLAGPLAAWLVVQKSLPRNHPTVQPRGLVVESLPLRALGKLKRGPRRGVPASSRGLAINCKRHSFPFPPTPKASWRPQEVCSEGLHSFQEASLVRAWPLLLH